MRQPRTWEAFSHYRSKIRHRLRRWRIWRGELPRDEEVDLAAELPHEHACGSSVDATDVAASLGVGALHASGRSSAD